MSNNNYKRLTRSRNRKIGGVCGGVGEYLGIDPTVVRVVLLFLVFFAGSGLLAYLIMWLVLPEQ